MIYHLAFIILFMIGFYTILIKRNLIKMVIGLSIMESALFFWIMAVNYREGMLPIIKEGSEMIETVNPLPQALILTGIVIGASTTAFLLALVIEINKYAHTIDLDLLKGLRE